MSSQEMALELLLERLPGTKYSWLWYPLPDCTCRPQKPAESEVSVTVIIQLAGSVVPVGQALADKVVPMIRKRKV